MCLALCHIAVVDPSGVEPPFSEFWSRCNLHDHSECGCGARELNPLSLGYEPNVEAVLLARNK